MMNIQESIKHAWDKSSDCNAECAEEHGQLALWLEELVALRRQVEELTADNAELWGGLKWLKAISFSHEDDLDQWPGEKTADYINGLIERPHPGATLLKERDEILARIGIAEKALGLACGWLAEEKLQGCSANHPLVLKAKDQIKHGALYQAKESLK